MRVALVTMWLLACRGHEPDASPPPVQVEPRRHPAPAVAASGSAFYAATFTRKPSALELTALGALAFRDPGLSASGKLACATCHDPDHELAPNNDRAIQLGGPSGTLAGTRATPSLRYLQAIPRFTEHFHGGDDDDAIDQGPAGGLTWDGRAQTTHEQASAPLLSPVEMANASQDEVVARLRKAPYADQLRAAFGADVLDATASAWKALVLALEVYQQDPATFYPYSSKFDAVIRHQASLTAQEARGKALFDDAKKGNCASCHPDTVAAGFPAFTDFGYVALGVPRSRALTDPTFFDLGLCGPYRHDLAGRADYCGMFRTPSLRNAGTRKRYFHNGSFTSLAQVVAFYATRDVHPERWYPRGVPFDDLPPQYRANVNKDPPFGTTKPALDEAEIADVVAFLMTLDDGFRPWP